MPFILSILVALCVWGVYEDYSQWNQFKSDHHCKEIGKMSGDVVTSIGSNGAVAIGVIPGKTGWSCDNGVTYWR